MDVTFITVKRNDALGSFEEINPAERKIRNYKIDEAFYRLNKSRVGGQEDEKYGLSKEQQEITDKDTNKASHYRQQRQKPLLLLYLIKVKLPEEIAVEKDSIIQLEKGIPTLAVSFPFGDVNMKFTILANQIYNDSLFDVSEEDVVGDDHDN